MIVSKRVWGVFYQAEIAAQEKELQDLEYRRLRRLLAEGIITAHDFHEQVNFK